MEPTTARPAAAGDAQATRPYLLFQVHQETFGVEIARVREIVDYGPVTPVPMMPPHVKGVTNLRGKVLPIVDLSSRLGLGPLAVGRRTGVVVVELQQPGQGVLAVGVMVSGVSEVVDFPVDRLEPPPALGAAIRTRFIAGMARHRERFLILLELSEVLSLEELAAALPPGGPGADLH